MWKWSYDTVGKREAVIVDAWWRTENGGFLCSTKPALDPMKPGSAGPGVPGIYPVIYDENGKELPAGSVKAGNICIRNPWPESFRQSGEIASASSASTTRSTTRIRRARTGTTGRISPATAHCSPKTDTSGFSGAWMM